MAAGHLNVNDVTSAMTQAKEAAGDKNVLVYGAATAQLALAAGVLDELELHRIRGLNLGFDTLQAAR